VIWDGECPYFVFLEGALCLLLFTSDATAKALGKLTNIIVGDPSKFFHCLLLVVIACIRSKLIQM